jgi:hypothetical protein
MKPIAKVVNEWARAYCNNVDVEISEEGNRATARFAASEKGDFEYRCFVEGYENRSGVMVFHYAPFNVPQAHRCAVAEVLVRANYDLNNGALGMDMQDGEIRCKTGVDAKDGAISVTMINEMVELGTTILDQYLPAIAAVVYAGQTPEQAISRADKPDKLPDETASVVAEEEIRPWEGFSGCEAVRAWAEDLKSVLSCKSDRQEWALAGRAAVIVNEDMNYCREILQRVASDNGLNFSVIAANEVMDMSPLSGLKQFAPTLVYLEPGRWMKAKGDRDESERIAENVRNFQTSLADWLKGFDPKSPVIYVVSTGKLESIAKCLRNVGGFERFMSLPEQPMETLAEKFLDQIGKACCSESLLSSPGKLGKLLKSETDNQRKLAVLCIQRLQRRKNRLLEFIDLVHAFSHSLQEEGASAIEMDELRQQVAYHEAGHAVVAMLDSDGRNIPEYTSIVPSVAFTGIVVESYAFHHVHDDLNTYRNLRHNIRVCLAARAAEEVAFGIENVSSASSGDLENASRSAFKAFLYWGFVPQMETGLRAARNLGVVFGPASDSEMSHAEVLVREFLEQEYEAAKFMLEQNRSLLDAVAVRLISDPILDQQELGEIFSGSRTL